MFKKNTKIFGGGVEERERKRQKSIPDTYKTLEYRIGDRTITAKSFYLDFIQSDARIFPALEVTFTKVKVEKLTFTNARWEVVVGLNLWINMQGQYYHSTLVPTLEEAVKKDPAALKCYSPFQPYESTMLYTFEGTLDSVEVLFTIVKKHLFGEKLVKCGDGTVCSMRQIFEEGYEEARHSFLESSEFKRIRAVKPSPCFLRDPTVVVRSGGLFFGYTDEAQNDTLLITLKFQSVETLQMILTMHAERKDAEEVFKTLQSHSIEITQSFSKNKTSYTLLLEVNRFERTLLPNVNALLFKELVKWNAIKEIIIPLSQCFKEAYQRTKESYFAAQPLPVPSLRL